ncbi:MAG TPA: ABC transporter permease [Woeseiaceae bacterium]|nr:ABC transporter permease [Woeseiaceae bacterium]
MSNLWHDLRYAVRTLLKSPGFAAVAILSLTLGIGANTAIFSVVSSVLLQPLPYAEGDELVLLEQHATHAMHGQAQQDTWVSVKELEDYRQRNRTLDGVAEYHSLWFTLFDRGKPVRVQSGVVSSNFFDLMGIRPMLGRAFAPGELRDHEAVLLLSHDFWQSHFDGDPAVIGRTVEMNDRIHTIVGVLPDDLPQYPRHNDVWMPWYACPWRTGDEWQENRDLRVLTAIGRLGPAISLSQAEDDVARIAREMQAEHPEAYPDSGGFETTLSPLKAVLTDEARPVFLVLLGMAGFILLIACANVTNLTLARMAGREDELAVRAALGAGRGRLMRQLVTESTVLALAGGALGMLLAFSAVDLFVAFAGRFTPRAGEVQVDGWLLLFTAGVSLVAGLAVGLVSSLLYGRNVAASLGYGGGRSTEGTGRQRVRNLLVVSQLAITFVLLIGAGLMLRSFIKLQQVDPGFSPENVLTMQIDLDWSVYQGDEDRREFFRTLLERTRAIPGVRSAALAGTVPLGGGLPNTGFRIEGRSLPEDDTGPRTDVQNVSPGYFETLRIPLLRGRTFTERDHDEALDVAVINQSLARRYWGDADPIGTRIGDGENWVTIVGVVGDVKQEGLADKFAEQVYAPIAQSTPMGVSLLIRTRSDPMSVAREATAAVHSIDPRHPVACVRTLADVRSDDLASPRLVTLLLTLFAALALIISVAGIVGLVAFTASQRTRELGIRIALGAGRGSVLWMVIRRGIALTLIGLAVGTAGALVLTRSIGSWLYNVTPTDLTTFLSISLVFISTAVLAAYVPARRAARVDPMIALRDE